MRKLLSVVLGLSLTAPLMANEVSFEQYVESLKQQARSEGISEQILSDAFKDVAYKPRAVKADRNQPEKKIDAGRIYSPCSARLESKPSQSLV